MSSKVNEDGEIMSESVPFLPRNPTLDTFPLVGDAGFGERLDRLRHCRQPAPVLRSTCILVRKPATDAELTDLLVMPGLSMAL